MKLTFTLLFIGISVSCIAQTDIQTNSQIDDKHSLEVTATYLAHTREITKVTQHLMGFNVQYLYRLNKRSSMGTGTGLEYFNRGQNIEITQIPFYIQVNKTVFKEHSLQVDFKPGFILPVRGTYLDDNKEEMIFKNEEFVYSPFYEFGLTFKLSQRLKLRAMMRNQSTGVIYPTEERRTMYGLQFIFN